MVSHNKHRITDAVEKKNKDKKKFPGEHWRCKTIERIDHQIIIHEAQSDLQEELTSMGWENDVHTEPSTSIMALSQPVEVEENLQQ